MKNDEGHRAEGNWHGRARLVVRESLADCLASRGVLHDADAAAIVFDPFGEVPRSWTDVEDTLASAFALAAAAKAGGAPAVFVVEGPAVYGQADPLRAMVATALLGAARSQAFEGARKAIPAFAVTVSPAPVTVAQLERAADAVAWLLSGRAMSGQVLHADDSHIGRPAA